jgi:hypothetical protein
MSAHRYLSAAQNVVETIPGIMTELGLDPMDNRYFLTETEQGDAWLFVVLDDRAAEFAASYAAPGVLSHLSAALQGHVVLFSNTNGLRYGVLLGSPDSLTRSV